MSDDFALEDQADLVANRIARDERLQLIGQSLDVEAELRDSPSWRYIRHRIDTEKADIAAGLAEAAPSDLAAITRLQARAIAAVLIPRWIGELISASRAAEEQIAVEDGRLPAID